LLDNLWDNGGFEQWDEDGSNLGNEGSGKGDIEIIWVDCNGRFLNLKFWCILALSALLFRNINFHIDAHLVDFNINVSSDSDPVGVREITGHVSCNSISNELGSVGGVVDVEGDVADWWLWKSNSDVLKETSIESNLWDIDVLDDVEDVWDSNVFGVVDTFLGDRYGDTWTVGSGSSGSDECTEFIHIVFF